MSVDEPILADDDEEDNPSVKRDAQNFKPFYVDDTFSMELSDKPAWEVSHLTAVEAAGEEQSKNASIRTKRNNNNRRRNDEPSQPQQQSKRPWECEAKIKWIDLGFDYYPRYLRTVECTRHACFYGHFTCKPRSFTVKLLRRRRGECVPTRHNIGVENLHDDLRELWVWEERAVNFCCDCSRWWCWAMCVPKKKKESLTRLSLYFLLSSSKPDYDGCLSSSLVVDENEMFKVKCFSMLTADRCWSYTRM